MKKKGMKNFFPLLFAVIAMGILTLGTLFFLLPSPRGGRPDYRRTMESSEKMNVHPDLGKGKAILIGHLYSPGNKPLALTSYKYRLWDEGAKHGKPAQWKGGPFSTRHLGYLKIFLEPCADAHIEIFVKGYGPAYQRLGPAPAGKTFRGIKFVLSEAVPVLKGKVIDSRGKAMPNMVLSLTNPDLDFNGDHFVTDEKGCFEVFGGSCKGFFTGVVLQEATGREISLKKTPAGTLDLVVVFEE